MLIVILHCYNYIISCAVVEVNIEMRNVTVPESDPNVEICFSLSSGITEEVIVTAETGPKAGAANQATGIHTYIHILHLLSPFVSERLGRIYIISATWHAWLMVM